MTKEPVSVYVIDDLRVPQLQLHVRPNIGVHCSLYGWDVTPLLVDEGPPPILQDVFAAALVRCGTLSFLATPSRLPSHSGWFAAGDEHWLRLSPTPSDWLRHRRPPWIMATDNPEQARALFAGTPSWGNQHQIAFILKKGQFPILTRRLVVDLLGARDAVFADFSVPNEIMALALPAVDGDFLEIVAPEKSTREMIRAAIADECSRRRITFSSRQTLQIQTS
jgi:hypothetical protein